MRRTLAVATLAALLMAGASTAQEYPSRTVTIIGTSGPGALTDILARAVGERLSQRWGKPVVIEARPGAAYAIAATAVLRSAADGHTLIASELGMFTYQQYLYDPGARPFDGLKDFAPITGIAEIPVAIIANPSVPANSIAELIALAKSKPEALTYGTAGPGTFPHLSMLMLQSLTGAKFLPVHYRGVALALNDVSAGHVNLIAMGPSIAIPGYRAGKLKILGVGSDQPLSALPEVPTVSATVAGYSASVGFGLGAPAATPRTILDRINREVQVILNDEEFQKKVFAPQGLQPMKGDVDDFTAQLHAQAKRWEQIIVSAGLRLN